MKKKILFCLCSFCEKNFFFCKKVTKGLAGTKFFVIKKESVKGGDKKFFKILIKKSEKKFSFILFGNFLKKKIRTNFCSTEKKLAFALLFMIFGEINFFSFFSKKTTPLIFWVQFTKY